MDEWVGEEGGGGGMCAGYQLAVHVRVGRSGVLKGLVIPGMIDRW